MTKENYRGVIIRKYGERPGEGVYPLCFTDNLQDPADHQPVLHDTWEDARQYIDRYHGKDNLR